MGPSMSSPAPEPSLPRPNHLDEQQIQKWDRLVEELRELNAQLEYISLMLRIGTRMPKS